MSGKKIYNVSITNVAWEKIQQEVYSARSEAADARNRQRNAEAQAQQRIKALQDRCNQEIQGLNQAFQSQARKQAQDLQRVQQNFDNRINQQQTAFKKELENQARQHTGELQQTREDFEKSLRKQRAELNQAMRDQKADLEKQLRNSRAEIQEQIQSVVKTLEMERKSQAEIAGYWISQADILLKDLDAKYRHRLFAPGVLDELFNRQTHAQGDLTHGMNDAALVTARDTVNSAMELRERVIMAEAEWSSLFNLANRLAVDTKNRLEGLESLEYTLEENNETLKVAAEIDFWSSGKIIAVKDELTKLERCLDKPDTIPTEQMEEIINRLQELNNRISEAEAEGRNNFLASEIRRKIGAEMEHKLPGWNVEELFFRGEDDRQDMHVIFRHQNGQDQIAMTIQGGHEGPNSAQISTDFLCKSHSSKDIRDGWITDITKVIQESQNLEVQRGPIPVPQYADALNGDLRVFDVETMKKPLTN